MTVKFSIHMYDILYSKVKLFTYKYTILTNFRLSLSDTLFGEKVRIQSWPIFHFQKPEADSAADGSNIYLVIIKRCYKGKTSGWRTNHNFVASYSCSVPCGQQDIISGNLDCINKINNAQSDVT